MKVAILGYGKMGKMIEQLLLDDHHTIVATIDNEEEWQTRLEAFKTAEVAIDFSMPTVAVANMLKCFEYHVPVVVGTTGWLDQLGYVCDACRQLDGSLVYGANFSIGANLFMQLNKILADMMNRQGQYAASMDETHHTTKKDAPSGTAVRLAKDILDNVDRFDHWELTQEGESIADPMALPVNAHRIGTVPGIHTITWHSEDDDIVITHNAHSRRGFAMGAVQAAKWLVNHPGIHDFQNIALNLMQGQ